MADNQNQNQNNDGKGGNANDGADSKDKKNDQNSSSQNNSNNNGDSKGDMIPKHRFDEVNTELEKFRAEKAERESKDREAQEKKLVEEKKWEELSTKREQELTSERTKLSEVKTQMAVERSAGKAGIVDTEAAFKLIDRSKITVDSEGNVQGVDEAIKQLLTDKPYLKGSGTVSTIGSGTNPDNGQSDKKFAMSWVRKHYADMPWGREKHPDMGFGDLTGMEILEKIEKDRLIDYNS